MYATDLLIQMAACAVQNTVSAPSAGKTSSNANTGSDGTSFQDLLEKQQGQSSGTSDKATGTTAPEEEAAPSPTEEKKDPSQVPSTDLMALEAALVAERMPQLQTALPVENTAAQASAPLTAVAEETPVLAQQTIPTPSDAPSMDVQPASPQGQQEATSPQAVSAPVSEPIQAQQSQTQTPTDTNSGFSDNLADAKASSAPQQEHTDEPVDVSGTWESPLFQTVEHMPVKVGEAVTVDTTAPSSEMEATLSKAMTDALGDGSQHLEIQLSPSNLGTVTVEFSRNPEGALHVVLHTENEQAAKLLSDHASALGLLLQDGTHSEVRVEVSQPQQNQQPWQQPDQNGGQRQQQQQQNQQPQQQHRQDAESFLHQLRLGLVELEAQAV